MKSENKKKEVIITKDYYQQFKNNEYNFNDIPELLKDLKGEDPIKQFKGLLGIKKLCEEDKKVNDSKYNYNELLPNLFNFIKNYPEEFQYESLKCLINIEKINFTKLNSIQGIPLEETNELIGIIISFITNHDNFKLNIFIPALRYLSILSNINNPNSNQISNILYNEKIKDKIMDIIKAFPDDLYIIKKCIKALYKICKHTDFSESYSEISEDVIQILSGIIKNNPNDIELIIWSLCLMTTLTQSHSSQILLNKIIDLNLLQNIIDLTNIENNDLIYYSLRIIGNFAMMEDSQYTDKILEMNVLEILKKFLDKQYIEKIRKESTFTLSNIAAGTQEQIIKLFKSDVFPILSDIITKEPESDIKNNCLWTIYNFSCLKNKKYLDNLVEGGIMKIIIDRFNIDTGNVLCCSLEALDNIMKFDQKVRDPAIVSITENQIINLNVFEALNNLKNNNNEELCHTKINNILKNYFKM